jgi:hypothetical protein
MSEHWSRRQALGRATTLLVSLAAALRAVNAQAQAKIKAEVYKDPSCGCCGKWVDHMNASGFDAIVVGSDRTKVRARFGISDALASCHTAVIGGYAIEGHVPSVDVKRLLTQKPAGVVGLTIPGMPQSAPGMDVTPFQPYTVLSFDRSGKTTVFAKHDKA